MTAQLLLRTYGLAAAMELSRGCRGLRSTFVNLHKWTQLVGPSRKIPPFVAISNKLNKTQRVMCGSCFKFQGQTLFVPIDNAICPICKSCLADVWDNCKSIRKQSFASLQFREARMDSEDGIVVSFSYALKHKPFRFPMEEFEKVEIRTEGVTNGYHMVDVLCCFYRWSAGQPGMDAIDRMRDRIHTDQKREGMQTYRTVFRQIVHCYDANIEPSELDYAQSRHCLRISDGIETAIYHARTFIIQNMFRKITRDEIGCSFPFTINFDMMRQVFREFLGTIDMHMVDPATQLRIGYPPRSLKSRPHMISSYIKKDQFRTWEKKIRNIVPMIKAIIESHSRTLAISLLPKSFLDRNLWAYYTSLSPGMLRWGASPPSEFHDDLVPESVDEALCFWHFFHSADQQSYNLDGGHAGAQNWIKDKLQAWIEIKTLPPAACYKSITQGSSSKFLTTEMIDHANDYLRTLALSNTKKEVSNSLNHMLMSNIHGDDHRGMFISDLAVKEKVDAVPLAKLKRLVSIISLRNVIGLGGMVEERYFRRIIRSMASEILVDYLLCQKLKAVTDWRIATDELRPINEIRYRNLEFPQEVWNAFEHDLLIKVRKIVGRSASSKDEAVSRLHTFQKWTPMMELYVRSNRFTLGAKAILMD